jgi:MFS family permease
VETLVEAPRPRGTLARSSRRFRRRTHADLPRRRRVLLAGLGVFAASSPAAGLATSAAILIAARAVQGLGAASVAPAALALMTLFHSAVQG